MNIALWLERTAHRRPHAPALLRGGETLRDYGGFAADAGALAAGLRTRHGIAPGDRVGLYMPNSGAYLVAMQAAWRAGAAVLPIDAKLHPREAKWILDDAGCDLLFVRAADRERFAGRRGAFDTIAVDGPEFAALLDLAPLPAPHSRRAEDLAWLFYTSGTTGRPKGVMLGHGNLAAMAMCYFADVDSLAPDDAMLYAAPLSHAAGFYALPAVRAGAAHIAPPSGGFDPGEVLDTAQAHGKTSFFAAPTMLRRLVAEARRRGARGAGIGTIVYGGGPMYLADILEAMDTLECRFAQIYGQGETPMCITAFGAREHAERSAPRYRERLASVGAAQSTVEIRIAGADGAPLPPGTPGEIEVRGPSVMLGYWKRPQATAEAVRDGWLRTGDIGALDEDGYLTLHDRSKDMIVSGGANVYPREVEEVLLTHGDVAEAAVVGRPHREWGEEVVAFVVPAPGARLDERALDALCLDNIARFKRPRAYFALDALPRNHYGKALKTELRRRLAGAQQGDPRS